MQAYVGITDRDWFDLLRSQPQLDEVNFWQPGGNRQFNSLNPGELFLFKLHSPYDYIVGGGIFALSSLLAISLAWESFEPGLSLWKQLQITMPIESIVREEATRYGQPVLTLPRLGQGSFRVLVPDVYERRCAVTSERTLPALDAAHIKPYSESGQNIVSNGILLRRDLHALFDTGYVTITPSMKVEVSCKIKEEFENGRDYYRLQGSMIHLPVDAANRPSREYLEWHNSTIYRG